MCSGDQLRPLDDQANPQADSQHSMGFSEILDCVWRCLRPSGTQMTDQEYGCLFSFVRKVRSNQSCLIEQICRERHINYADSCHARAACLYLRLHAQTRRLADHLSGKIRDAWYRYLYRVMEFNLIACNKQEIKELMAQTVEHKMDTDPQDPHANPNQQSIDEHLYEIEVDSAARELKQWMLQTWSQKHLNVLCHYYEALAGIPTTRLADETASYIDQLHHRLRNRIFEMQSDKGASSDVMRRLLGQLMSEICQEVPPSRTYKYSEGDT